MKIYIGERTNDRCRVKVVRRVEGSSTDLELGELDPRHDLRNHSPDGFNWGYGGSGPSQLALALVADHLGVPRAQASPHDLADQGALRRTLNIYQDLKWGWVAGLRSETWELTEEDLGILVRACMVRYERGGKGSPVGAG